MSTPKKTNKGPDDNLQAAMQNLITQGRKDGMIRASDLNSVLEKMDLTPDKIEEIWIWTTIWIWPRWTTIWIW